MRYFRARLAPALLLVLLVPSRPAPAQDPAREVERLERDLVAAIGRGDLWLRREFFEQRRGAAPSSGEI